MAQNEFSPSDDCGIDVDVGDITIDDVNIEVPPPPATFWSCRCLVEAGAVVGCVKILTCYDKDEGTVETTMFLEQTDGALVPFTLGAGQTLTEGCDECTDEPTIEVTVEPDITVEIDDLDLSVQTAACYWADRCIVLGDVNIGCVKVLNCYDPESGELTSAMFTEAESGLLEPVVLPEGAVVDVCRCATDGDCGGTGEGEPGLIAHWADRCLIRDGVNIGCVAVLTTIDPATGELTTTPYTEGDDGSLSPVALAEGDTIETCICADDELGDEGPCSVTVVTACDGEYDPENDDYIVIQSPVYAVFTACPGQPVEVEVFADLELTVPYDVQGSLLADDCLTLLTDPPAPKPEGDIIKTTEWCVNTCVAIVDNNAGLPAASLPFYHYADEMDFETVLVDGTVINWSQPVTTNWTPQFLAWMNPADPTSFYSAYTAAVPECAPQIGCGTTGCAGFPGLIAEGVDAGLTVFARHLSIVCCDEGKLPATTTVLATTQTRGVSAPVGHTQDHQPTCVEVRFTEIVVCDDPATGSTVSYFVDAHGNTIDPRTLPPMDCWQRCDESGCDLCELLGDVVTECTGGHAGSVVEYELPPEAATEQSYGIGEVITDTPGIKFDTGNPLSPELTETHQAIIDCIEMGGVANVVITDQDGNTVELDLDLVGGDGNPQYFYGGTVIDGDPGGGKVRRMVVTCNGAGEPAPALSTIGCLDEAILDKLCDIDADTSQLIFDADGNLCTSTTDKPEPICPPPTVEVWCDTDGTQFVDLAQLAACGPSGTFEAVPYVADGTLIPYTPLSPVRQLCDDAEIKDQQCVVDSCGDRYLCVDVITVVDGTPVESQTCIPWVDPCLGDEAEAPIAEPGIEAREVVKGKRLAIKSVKTAVASIKIKTETVNEVLTETTNPDTGERPQPVGETCPCPCPDEPAADVVDCGPCTTLHRLTTGRPNNGATWAWGPYSANSYAELSALMAADGISEFILAPDLTSPGEGHYVCGDAVPDGAELFVDGVSQGIPPTFDNPNDEGRSALLTVGCNDDKIFEKLCDLQPPTVACLECAVMPFNPGQVFASPIVATLDGAGMPVTLPDGPYDTVEAFADAIGQQGYQVEIDYEASTFTACGPDRFVGYVLDDGTVVTAVGTESKDGLLVCDPNTAALAAAVDQLLIAQNTTNDLLAQLVECLCECPDDDDLACPDPVLTAPVTGTTNATGSGWNYSPGTSNDDAIEGNDVVFPNNQASHGGNHWNDIETVLTADLSALDPTCYTDGVAVLQIDTVHSIESTGGHRGHWFTVANGTLIAETNNEWSGGTLPGGSSTTFGGPGTTELAEPRSLTFEVPVADLLTGVAISTTALGGANANLAEWFDAIDISIADILSADGVSCCGPGSAPVAEVATETEGRI